MQQTKLWISISTMSYCSGEWCSESKVTGDTYKPYTFHGGIRVINMRFHGGIRVINMHQATAYSVVKPNSEEVLGGELSQFNAGPEVVS